MQLKEYTDTSTPTESTQAVLRSGAFRIAQGPLSQVGTAITYGAVVAGGQGYCYEMLPTDAPSPSEHQEADDFVVAINEHLRPTRLFADQMVVINKERISSMVSVPEPDTDDLIPPELQRYLRSTSQPTAVEPTPASEDIDFLDARLVPPAMEQHRVRVRFRFIGEERPRVVTDAEIE